MGIKDRLYGVPLLGTAVRVQDRYRADAADQLAASIGLFGFLSLFPLIILAVAIGGFVVRNTPGADVDVVRVIRDSIPGLAGLVDTELESIVADVARRAGAILGVGAVTLLLSGMRVVNGAMVATTRVFRMPQPEGLTGWLRKLGALFLLGVLALAGAAAASVVGVDVTFVPRPVAVALGLLTAFGFDLLLFLVAYRVLAASEGPPWRVLLPGAAFAAAGWVALKTFGATWVAQQAARANDLYGTLGGIIALLLLFYLAGRLYLYGAELSAYLQERRGPGEAPSAASDPSAAASARPGSPSTAPSASADGPSIDTGATSAEDDVDPPPPPPPGRRRGPGEGSPAVSASTLERLRAADVREPPGGAEVRGAIAFAIAVAAVAGLVYAAKPWESDD